MKKIGLLCLALVLALGTLGIGYATWSANVTIEQTIETGSLTVGVRDVGTNDDEVGDTGADPGQPEGKNVASCNSTNVVGTEICLKGQTQYYTKVEEVITNAYPCYSCNITYEFANCGTIPTKLKDWVTTVDASSNMCEWVELTAYSIIDTDGSVINDDGSASEAELKAALQALQIHGCENITLTITKHIMQDHDTLGECPMNGYCKMTHEAKWVQFNMVNEP
jgi:hypothetical protein